MTEVDYQHECSRAELLGLPKPSREEFFSKQRETTSEGNAEEEEMTVEQAEEAGARQEGFRRIGGGLDELNSILSNTQKKLNRFKAVCGSFTNLLKIPVGGSKGENENPSVDAGIESSEEKNGEDQKPTVETPSSHTNKDGNSQLGKLDSLINKAERAELSLSSQNKQMKKFLN